MLRLLPAHEGHWDELRDASGALREPWRQFFERLGEDGIARLDDHCASIAQQIRDNDISYNVYADNGEPRPWALDLLPFLISEADWAHLQRALVRLYPALSDMPIEKRWFGRVAMTPDHLPHIHEPEKGLLAVVGCQGRGVGLMSALGKRMANYLACGDPRQLPFPLSPIRPIPFHAFRQVGVAATIAWYRMLDAFER